MIGRLDYNAPLPRYFSTAPSPHVRIFAASSTIRPSNSRARTLVALPCSGRFTLLLLLLLLLSVLLLLQLLLLQ